MRLLSFLFFVFATSALLSPGIIGAEPKRKNQCLAQALSLLSHVEYVRSADEAFVLLSRKESFQKFLLSHGIQPEQVHPADQAVWVSKYHQNFLQIFENPKTLKLEQDKTLARELTLRGTSIQSSESPRSALKRTSQKNVKRLNQLHPLQEIPPQELKELEALVNQIDMFYTHSTHILKKAPEMPVLSSKRIEEYGTKGGLNTHPFNKEIMQTDDNVFFRVGFRKKGAVTPKERNYYGDTDLVIDSEYARESGIISHFVMTDFELLEFGATYFPEQYKSLYERYQENLKLPQEVDRKMLEKLRAKLYLADYTVSDFELMTRQRITQALYLWKHNAPEKFLKIKTLIETGNLPRPTEKQIHILRKRLLSVLGDPEKVEANLNKILQPSAGRFENLIKKEILAPLGLSSNWELKVPVAVPQGYLRIEK